MSKYHIARDHMSRLLNRNAYLDRWIFCVLLKVFVRNATFCLKSGSVVVEVLFNVPPIVCGGSVSVFAWYALLYIHSSFAIILVRKRELVDLPLLC